MTNQEFIESIRLEGEEWRDVPGWEGLYAFSSEGRLVSLRTEFYYKNRDKPRRVKPFLMNGTHNKTRNGGYCTLKAYIHRRYETFYVHILVAKAFVYNPDPDNYTEVDHIDGNPRNNKASNLRWTNRSGNMMNQISRKRQSIARRGKERECSWIPVVRIATDGSVVFYKNITSAAKDGFCQSSVTVCCQGKRHSHRGFRWMYLSDYENLVSMSKNSKSIQETDQPQ